MTRTITRLTTVAIALGATTTLASPTFAATAGHHREHMRHAERVVHHNHRHVVERSGPYAAGAYGYRSRPGYAQGYGYGYGYGPSLAADGYGAGGPYGEGLATGRSAAVDPAYRDNGGLLGDGGLLGTGIGGGNGLLGTGLLDGDGALGLGVLGF